MVFGVKVERMAMALLVAWVCLLPLDSIDTG
jgi:hypothetical protein